MILAGDVGGTKTALALFERSDAGPREVRSRTFPSREYPSLETILAEFLEDGPRRAPDAACFGIAGPVLVGAVKTTNLPWRVETESLAAATRAPRVTLLNDLQAAAYGMLRLAPDELATLQAGSDDGPPGNAAVLAPGTGLGEAMLYWDGKRYHAIASEGGHADFAARTDREVALSRHLRERFGEHVSYERVLSGDGIHRIYDFLRKSDDVPEPAWLGEAIAEGDPNAAITRIGLAAGHPLCVATLDLFCSILAAEAGNLALRSTATSGVFLAGGIAPRILPALRTGNFVREFNAKGRFAEWMTTVPIRVSLNPLAPLLGAAQVAFQDLGEI